MLSGTNQLSGEASEQSPVHLEPDVELLLASAKAIQRLIAERTALRERVTALEDELWALRQQTTLVHDGYRKLTDEFVTQFKLIDSAVRNLVRDKEGSRRDSLPQPPSMQRSESDHPPAAA
jgi:hypothetical protein